MIFTTEIPTKELAAEIAPLAREWWETISEKPFKPNFDTFFTLYNYNALTIFTARDGYKLGGYAIGIHMSCPFSSQKIVAIESMQLHKDYRIGFNGLRFLRFIVNHFDNTDIDELGFSSTIELDIGSLLKRIGCTKISENYRRVLCPHK